MKSTYLMALISGALSLTGCGGDAETEVCRYYVQQDLDKGNYQAVIDRLESDTASCRSTYTEEEYLVDLGAAYLGRAGLTMPTVIKAMLDETEDDEAAADDERAFNEFIRSVADGASSSAITDLSLSRASFSGYLGDVECPKNIIDADTSNITDTQKGICLLTSFVDILKTTMAVDAMTNGQIDSWLGNTVDDTEGKAAMFRATCALEYANANKKAFDEGDAFDDVTNSYVTVSYNECHNGTAMTESKPVTFTSPSGNQKSYNSLTVSSDGEVDYYLEALESGNVAGTTVFTSGYCTELYAECSAGDDACYACPMDQGGEDLSVQEYVLDALNGSLDSLSGLVDDDDMKQEIDDYRREINNSSECSAVSDGDDNNITLAELTCYLNTQDQQ